MNKEFNLSSRDYADILGISTDNLRQRRRRKIETNYIQDDKGNYWWKRDRPTQDKKDTSVRPKKNGLSRVPGQRAIDTKKRNRGALARGDKSDYPNWRFEEANRVKALAKIRDKLGDEVVDEITPELFKLAKQNVNKRKQNSSK